MKDTLLHSRGSGIGIGASQKNPDSKGGDLKPCTVNK